MPTISECIDSLCREFQIVDVIDCDQSTVDLYLKTKSLWKESFSNSERIIFVITKDRYNSNGPGITLQGLQSIINDIDISNFFICLVTTNPDVLNEYDYVLKNISIDDVSFNLYPCQGDYQKINVSNELPFTKQTSVKNLSSLIDNLSIDHKKMLFESKSFCIMPWVGMNIETNSSVKPCCESTQIIGDCSTDSLSKIWNSTEIKDIRKKMLSGTVVASCDNCYKKELLGRDSLRKSINRKYPDKVYKLDITDPDGHLNEFSLEYWDIRYNNLCNLACRSCNPKSSSSWHQPAVKIGMIDKNSPSILIAGRHNQDIFQQIIEHIDVVNTIYFAGGEPLMIDNFYKILEMLEANGRTDVHLLYNTNLTRLSLKDKNILSLWKKFPNISIGASLDASHTRGEYLRQNLIWKDVVDNRRKILQECPHVDFYVSATTGILNAWHLPDFHKEWVDMKLLSAEDFNIQILYGPEWMRVDSAPLEFKKQIKKKYQSHLDWLIPLDSNGRATYGFNSILNYINHEKAFDPDLFWKNANMLDQIHNTNLLDAFPELSILQEKT